MDSFVSHGIAFLVGTATGAAGAYFAEKFTDRRREKEGQRKEEERFLEVAAMMPDLVTEMRQGLSQHPNFRDFFVIDKGLQLWASKNSFVYSECDGNDYLSKVRIVSGPRLTRMTADERLQTFDDVKGDVDLESVSLPHCSACAF